MFLPLILAMMSPATVAEPAPMPEWLTGRWESAEGETWMDEAWTPARGGMMIGAARVGSGDRVELWETTRIERKTDGTLSFFAQPLGAPAAEFPLVKQAAQMAEFANPAHDYPQRIRYWRDGDRLMAEISLMDGSKPERFEYALAK